MESMETDLRGDPGFDLRKRALLVTRGVDGELRGGILVEKSSMDMEF